MRGAKILKEVLRRETRRAQGINPHGPRLYSIQATAAQAQAETMALPVDLEGLAAPYSVGSMPLMLDYSALDGSDPLE